MSRHEDLKKLLNTPAEKQLITAKATYYPNFVRVYIPKQPYFKDPSGYEKPVRPSDYQPIDGDELDESPVERSIRRSRKKVKDYVLCNTFELFATFTFRENRQDIKLCKRKMSMWLKNQRVRNGRFSYLVVPELHKDNESLHFHALLSGYKGSLKQSFNAKTGKPIKQGKHNVYEIPSYTLGFTNVKIIDDKIDSQTKVGFYIQKYITKDMPLFHGKNRYWVSKGLKVPPTEDNPERWYEHVKADREYPTDNGLILEFEVSKHALVAIYSEGKL